jgi:hypothetical protein
VCDRCGTHRDWWDESKGGHRFALIADAHRCPGCEIKAEAEDDIPSTTKGVHVFLKPNPEVIGHV